MFGQKNNDDQQDELSAMDQAAQQVVADSTQEKTAPEVPGDGLSSPADETVSIPPMPDSITSEPTLPTGDTPAADSAGQDWQHPGSPLDDGSAAAAAPAIRDVISPYSADAPAAPAQPQPASSLPPISIPSLNDNDTSSTAPADTSDDNTPASDTGDTSDGPAADSDLVDIKQKALGELSPLIDELDQAPEDKFRTIMMMIQASDDQNLVPKAYEAAHSIQDEKARAQALLDVVNEINYFTQQSQS